MNSNAVGLDTAKNIFHFYSPPEDLWDGIFALRGELWLDRLN